MSSKPLQQSDRTNGARHCPDCGNFADDGHECPEPTGSCDYCGQPLPRDPTEHECPDLSDDGEIPACPEEDCQSASILYQSKNKRWYCPRCKTPTDEPEMRVRKNTPTGQGLSGSARILWDANPSEYP